MEITQQPVKNSSSLNLKKYTSVSNLSQWLNKQAKLNPRKTALIEGHTTLNYAQYHQQSNQLARYLISLQPGTRIAIYLENSIDKMLALAAIIKIGACYIPLNSQLPPERMAYILADTEATAIITKPEHTHLFQGERAQIITFSKESYATQKKQDLNIHHHPNDLLYILYTSGSTGRPKGVMIDQKAAVNLLWGAQQLFKLKSSDNILCLSSFIFDISLVELFLPWLSGAQLTLIPDDSNKDLAFIQQVVLGHEITFMQATPTFWDLYLSTSPKFIKGTQLISTGEALPKHIAEKLLSTQCTIWNLYGPTESTVWTTGLKVTASTLKKSTISIGKPLSNVQCHILNEKGKTVAPGKIGELYIGGDGLAQGYVNLPELTHRQFPRIRIDRAWRRVYKTGDYARYLPDGNIEFLGRKDDQIKISGYRIELNEIEYHLLKHPAIKGAKVLDREFNGQRVLVAYLVLDPIQTNIASLRACLKSSSLSQKALIFEHRSAVYIEVNEQRSAKNQRFMAKIGDFKQALRKVLGQQLPSYMIPNHFYFLDEFPQTFSGKLDIAKLPFCLTPSDNMTTLPLSTLQAKLANIWGQVLNISLNLISARANFFELGGDSISAMKIILKIAEEFHQHIPIIDFLKNPTLDALVHHLYIKPLRVTSESRRD